MSTAGQGHLSVSEERQGKTKARAEGGKESSKLKHEGLSNELCIVWHI
jgi:hypothetical protein